MGSGGKVTSKEWRSVMIMSPFVWFNRRAGVADNTAEQMTIRLRPIHPLYRREAPTNPDRGVLTPVWGSSDRPSVVPIGHPS